MWRGQDALKTRKELVLLFRFRCFYKILENIWSLTDLFWSFHEEVKIKESWDIYVSTYLELNRTLPIFYISLTNQNYIYVTFKKAFRCSYIIFLIDDYFTDTLKGLAKANTIDMFKTSTQLL